MTDHTDENMLACIKAVTGYDFNASALPEAARAAALNWMRDLWTGYVNNGYDFGTASVLTIQTMRQALRKAGAA